MASIVNTSAVLRVHSEQNRAICSISGVNSSMTAEDAACFTKGIQTMYNRGTVLARIHAVSDIDMTDNAV